MMPVKKLMHLLGDRWTTGDPLEYLTVLNPFTGEPVAEFPVAGEADVSGAVMSAADAATWWGALAPADRGGYLRDAGARVAADLDGLIRLEALEMGKPVSAAREWTVGSASAFAEMADAADGFFCQPLDSMGSTQLRVPYGVAGLIVPWNFPVMMAIGQLAGLLAAGNTVVYKPSERSPMSAARLVELLALPPGVVNLVLGDGRTGAALVRDPRVGVVSFTGSVAAGRDVGASSGKLVRSALLELGGKDPVIVDADVDPTWAAELVAHAALLNSGQICASAERVYVHRDIAGPFLDALVKAAECQVMGDPLDPATTLGPLVNERQREVVARHVAEAVSGGARALIGGVAPAGVATFYPPTVLVDVTGDMRVMQDETFGPVIPVQVVDSFDDAVLAANTTEYGLAAVVLTENPEHIARAGEIHAGIVWVNGWQAYAEGMVYEPAKASGTGRMGGAVDFLAAVTQPRAVVVSPH
jgi:acyl-CoA reductase-like NAD-dependent aldehyde dehydrogenase